MKKIIIVFFISSVHTLLAQTVFSAAGNVIQTVQGSVSYTIGESIVTTVSNANAVITQGFQQPKLKVITASDELVEQDDVIIYPNPTFETIYFSNIEKIQSVSIFDALGKLILIEKNVSQGIGFQSFSVGIYLLEIKNLENKVFTKKVVKL